ncbi:MAG: hypothetical protein LBH04_08685 [Tannerellaceae bacterium]|jgi:glutaredoxin|nr:hypothetical protein [Tannerellaceae bacterium]
MKYIIIHFPFKINKNRFSASQLRPLKIINAFINIGYKVDVIEGSGKERRKQIRQIKNDIKYEFCYSESSTLPTLLTESHHLPTYLFLDFSFFTI